MKKTIGLTLRHASARVLADGGLRSDRFTGLEFDGARDWSNALVIDLIESFERPATCAVEFQSGKAVGAEAAICEDSG